MPVLSSLRRKDRFAMNNYGSKRQTMTPNTLPPMKRRDFLSTGLGFGLGIPTGTFAAQASEKAAIQAIPVAGQLNPPSNQLIQGAVAASAATTWIDFVGPQAVFETWHFDSVEKKHKPQFKVFLVSETTEPVSHLVPDYSFETAP